MKKNLKILVSSILVILTFSVPQIHPSHTMESIATPITLILPDNRRVEIEVNLDQNLSDFRSDLISKGSIADNDIFQQKESDICRDDEEAYAIRNIMSNTLYFKPKGSESSHLFLKSQEISNIIRAIMIDDCIRQYKVLESANLTYGALYQVCTSIQTRYNERREWNKLLGGDEAQNKDTRCNDVLRFPRGLLEVATPNIYGNYHEEIDEGRSQNRTELQTALKADILESMELYKRLHGQPHPCWDGFTKM